jgi:hypothetical protein
MIEKAGLSLRRQRLSNTEMGHPFVDFALLFALKPRKNTRIHLTKVTSFDGLSLSAFDPNMHFRDAITIRKGGSVKRGGGNSFGVIAEESLDAISDIQGIPLKPLAKIGNVLLRMSKLVQHDDEETFESPLTLSGEKIGASKTRVRKYHLLDKLPGLIQRAMPNSETRELMGKPVLISDARVDLDLENAPVNREDGRVRLRIRENLDIGPLTASHRRGVIIKGRHSTQVQSTNPETEEVEIEQYQGQETLDLGPVEYKVIATSRPSHSD